MMKITRPGIYIVNEKIEVFTTGLRIFQPGYTFEVTEEALQKFHSTGWLPSLNLETSPNKEFPISRLIREDETPFIRVAKYNRNMGKQAGNPNHPDASALVSQASLIVEELAEVRDAIDALWESRLTNDPKVKNEAIRELRDGICDTLVTTYGMAYLLGVDIHADMKAVCDSNDSKFLKTFDEACDFLDEASEGLGLDLYIDDSQPDVFSVNVRDAEQTDVNGKVWPARKQIKGPDFKEPQFEVASMLSDLYIAHKI